MNYKILFVTKYVAGCLPEEFTYHGEWTDTFDLILAIKKLNPNIKILLLTPKVRDEHQDRFFNEFGKKLEDVDIKHYQLNFYFNYNLPPAIFRFKLFLLERKIILKEKLDIIQYGQFGLSYMYAFKKLYGIKVVAYGCYDEKKIWEGKYQDTKHKKQMMQESQHKIKDFFTIIPFFILKVLMKLLHIRQFDNKIDKIVLMHKQGFELLKNNHSNIVYIPKGCVYEGEYLQRESIENVFFLANLQYRKGIKEFLKVATFFPNLNFYIFGSTSDNTIIDLIEKYKENYQNIFFPGSLGHYAKWDVIKKMDLCLFPSYKDTFPSVIIESMALSIPVITTSSIDTRVIDGYNGYVCDAGDIDCFCKRIDKLIKQSDIYKRLSKNAYETYKKNTWEYAAKQFINLYREIL